MRPATLLALVLLVALVLLPAPVDAADPPVNTGLFGNLALDGYDPVAYFEDGRAIEGEKAHTAQWNGAAWRFASDEHRQLFEADPEAYAPQYGGYCAYAMAQGKKADADPEVWKIVDGKLYVNYDRSIGDRWAKDVLGYVEKADRHWAELVEED